MRDAVINRTTKTVAEARRMVAAVTSHPSNNGNVPAALVRSARHLAITRGLGKTTTTPLGRNSKIIVDRRRPASSRVVVGNPPDPAEMRVLDRLLKPGDLFVDVGANIGIYTVYAADLGATVIAMEPGDTEALHANIALNSLSVEVIKAAASNAPGEVQFSVGLDQQDAMVTSSSADHDVNSITVEATTVDAVLGDRKARIVKIDVEGFERFVVEGMERCLSQGRVDAIQLEWNRASEQALGEDRRPTAELLVKHGMVLMVPDNYGRLSPCTGGYNADESLDIFALTPELASELSPQ